MDDWTVEEFSDYVIACAGERVAIYPRGNWESATVGKELLTVKPGRVQRWLHKKDPLFTFIRVILEDGSIYDSENFEGLSFTKAGQEWNRRADAR